MTRLKATLKYVRVGVSCCGDDWIQTESSRYDLERLGCCPAAHAEEANLLLIQGATDPRVPAGEAVQRVIDGAVAAGLGDRDWGELVAFAEAAAAVELRWEP